MTVHRSSDLHPYLQSGAGTFTHIDGVGGDIGVADDLEVDGLSYFDGLVDAAVGLTAAYVFPDDWGMLKETSSQSLIALQSNNALVLTDYDYRLKNHDHGAQTHPTLFVHSATNPDTANTEWGSLAFVGTGAGAGYLNVGTGVGAVALNPAGQVLVNDNGTNAADFPNAQMYVGQGDTGSTYAATNIGTVVEAVADASNDAYGILGAATTSGAKSSQGVRGDAKVGATGATGLAIGVVGYSYDSHSGGDNIAVYGSAANGANSYSFYGAAGDFMNVSGKAIFNDNGTTYADFANTQMYVKQGDTGDSSTANTAIVGEALAVNASQNGIGVRGAGKAAGNKDGIGILGKGFVAATGDTGTAIGGQFNSDATHAGGTNYGILAQASASGVTNVAVRGIGYTNGAVNGYGVQGVGVPIATGDAGLSIGGKFEATGTHAGGDNVGVYTSASGSSTGNHALYAAAGDVRIEDGILTIKETTTPTAVTNYGKVYTKNDNKLYFQDGAGAEHEIAFVA